jgi:hypothetical protein
MTHTLSPYLFDRDEIEVHRPDNTYIGYVRKTPSGYRAMPAKKIHGQKTSCFETMEAAVRHLEAIHDKQAPAAKAVKSNPLQTALQL